MTGGSNPARVGREWEDVPSVASTPLLAFHRVVAIVDEEGCEIG